MFWMDRIRRSAEALALVPQGELTMTLGGGYAEFENPG